MARRGRNSESEIVQRREIADAKAVQRMLSRMAHEIVERNQGVAELAIVGIRTGGLFLAERLVELIRAVEEGAVPLGAIDISLYRDDVFIGLPKPVVGPTELPFALEGRRIVLVDDVLFTGRTIRAALDALMDYGRPAQVQLAVLVDRGLRELPIAADYKGMSVETTHNDSVRVAFREEGEVDGVVVRSKVAA